jgi:hypothetical protein
MKSLKIIWEKWKIGQLAFDYFIPKDASSLGCKFRPTVKKTHWLSMLNFEISIHSDKLDNNWPGYERTPILGTSRISKNMGCCHCGTLCHSPGLPRFLRVVCPNSQSSRHNRLPNDTSGWSFRGDNKHVSRHFVFLFICTERTSLCLGKTWTKNFNYTVGSDAGSCSASRRVRMTPVPATFINSSSHWNKNMVGI